MIVLTGCSLFTGNVEFLTMGYIDNRFSLRKVFRNWTVAYFVNIVGALFVVFVLAYYSGIMTVELFRSTAIHIAYLKAFGEGHVFYHGHLIMSMSFWQAIIRGVGCNWLISLGIYMSISSERLIGKLVSIWMALFTFSALGFEHAIANVYYIPMVCYWGLVLVCIRVLLIIFCLLL